jgi:SAM-dependent methyltransferase
MVMTLYQACKVTYRFVVPDRFRDCVYRATPGPLNRARAWLIRQLEKTGRHDEIYDTSYYAKHIEPAMACSAEAMADAIIAAFSPSTVIDVGCGSGNLLLALKIRGVRGVGYEYSAAALALCRQRALDVRRLDIERDPMPSGRADVVISTEVAEHLPESCADRFVDLLTGLADNVVLTAALPGQGGTDHVNEQPNEYWIAKFAGRGLFLDEMITSLWRRTWPERGVIANLSTNVLVFRRTGETRS